MDAAAVSYPGFEADLASLLGADGRPAALAAPIRCRHGDRDRRSRRGRQVHRRPRASPRELGFTYLDSGAMYRCVALAALEARRRPRRRRRRWARWPAGCEIELRRASGSLLDGRDVSAAIRDARGDRRRLARLRPPGGARGDGRPPARS